MKPTGCWTWALSHRFAVLSSRTPCPLKGFDRPWCSVPPSPRRSRWVSGWCLILQIYTVSWTFKVLKSVLMFVRSWLVTSWRSTSSWLWAGLVPPLRTSPRRWCGLKKMTRGPSCLTCSMPQVHLSLIGPWTLNSIQIFIFFIFVFLWSVSVWPWWHMLFT